MAPGPGSCDRSRFWFCYAPWRFLGYLRQIPENAARFLALVCILALAQLFHAQDQPLVQENAAVPLVPAYFVYGDSTVDVGNNNFLRTLARADIPPYGKDFDTHEPTGRFSNGRLSIDYLAKFIGLPFPAPFLSGLNITTMRHGANFASAGAGILSESGGDLGQHIPLVEQIQQVSDFKDQLVFNHGREAARKLMSRSLHYISIGSNDFIHYYLRNVSGVESDISPLDFNNLLVATLVSQLKILYDVGVRKMVVVGIGPLGCTPYFLYEDGSKTGSCISEINFMVEEYNNALRVEVEKMYESHTDLDVIYCDIYDGLFPIVQNPSSFGFQTATVACCGMGRFGGWLMCLLPEMACQNASTHVWWDEFHPTDRANEFLAKSIWSGDSFQLCHEMTLQQLIAQPDRSSAP
ncbi:hypothetical protein SELMODRAFT_80714 [Selaginella moellendorffii]|uniref:Uncharacterized protein n=1 Tax=Selaginella moellendorffii TaxID=88036 RepID=D8QWK0_SELML|nr:GDSL esterase/lipase 7 isoform X1 [Selaginella moellendorffii]EFJ35647.1 hypothetical protein SELMODRAFT_80714 [Selaginella moellendorffii]|eukprot:XP_002963776.1 GDSL esterase/lipase 7 isoform X1 [Selaginella moellendorffii]